MTKHDVGMAMLALPFVAIVGIVIHSLLAVMDLKEKLIAGGVIIYIATMVYLLQ